MVAVPSTMQALGSPAPEFELPNVCDNSVAIRTQDVADKPLLIMFICNHCPYVIHLAERMTEIANRAQKQGFGVFAISANDIDGYPQDGPDEMAKFAKEHGFRFPYLFDESQQVATAYKAACTPDFYVYDSNHRLQYRGQMDASRPSNQMPVTGEDLSKALNDVLEGRAPNENQVPSIGCNIKWRAGNEPSYF